MKPLKKVELARYFRFLSPAFLLALLVVAHYTLGRNRPWPLLAASLAGVVAGAAGIYLERVRFRTESPPESRYITHAIKHIALLTISVGLTILTFLILTGVIR
jgi:hypothetical protein